MSKKNNLYYKNEENKRKKKVCHCFINYLKRKYGVLKTSL